MAIDTESRRRAAGGIQGLRLHSYPTADGTINGGDRRHMAGLYPGLTTQTVRFFFWRETGNDARTWRETGDTTWTNQQSGDSNTTWKQVKDYPEQ